MKQLDRIEKALNEKKPVIQNDTTLDSTHREESHSWKIDMADITNLQPVGEGAWGKARGVEIFQCSFSYLMIFLTVLYT